MGSYFLPFIAALIGWFTNYIAIKMLFHPKKEVRFLFLKVQGVFPKRQKDLAKKLGKIVSSELFSARDVQKTLNEVALSPTIKELIGNKLETAIYEKIPKVIPMVAMFLSPELVGKIKNALVADIDKMLQELVIEIGNKLEDVLDVSSIVEKKVNDFSTDKLELLLNEIMRKEFKFIELVGGVLGFLIGLLQLLLVKVF
ncbi:MAG: DUF445 domain-containing protein [Bdellovibrionota bacterium]